MTVKTKFSKGDFHKIFSNYDLGKYKSSKSFAHGWCQTTVSLQTTEGKFVLRYYENRSEKHVLFEIKLLNYLRKKKYPVPAIIRNSMGGYLSNYKGKPYLIIEYLDGRHAKNPNNTYKQKEVSETVKTVAKLHNITRSYKSNYLKDREIYDTVYCLKEYKKRSRKIRKEEREEWLKNELNKLKFPNSLPKGICHCDLNYSNFLFKGGDIVGVLDFDMSCYNYLIYDIASLIYWWAWPPKKGLNEKKAKHILKEYSKYRKLNKFEKSHIFDALKLIILLGISWSKESDFKQEKMKIEYLNSISREGFYNKVIK